MKFMLTQKPFSDWIEMNTHSAYYITDTSHKFSGMQDLHFSHKLFKKTVQFIFRTLTLVKLGRNQVRVIFM